MLLTSSSEAEAMWVEDTVDQIIDVPAHFAVGFDPVAQLVNFAGQPNHFSSPVDHSLSQCFDHAGE